MARNGLIPEMPLHQITISPPLSRIYLCHVKVTAILFVVTLKITRVTNWEINLLFVVFYRIVSHRVTSLLIFFSCFIINVFINCILVFKLELKLKILCSVGTHGRERRSLIKVSLSNFASNLNELINFYPLLK